MRSRYTAYVREEIPYLYESLHPKRRSDYDEAGAREWAKQAEWQGLEIRETQGGGEKDAEGKVEFVARFRVKGEDQEHHELAEFKKDDGRWYFFDGKNPGAVTIVRDQPKIGRNDPCPCGSGKKYKKCCA